MQEFEVYIKNPMGIHARVAVLISKYLAEMESEVYFTKNTQRIDAKDVFKVMALYAVQGDLILVTVIGDKSEKEKEMIKKFIEENT